MSIDLILIVISSFFVFYGYTQGFIKQLSKLLAGFIAYILAKVFHLSIHNYLIENKWINENTSTIISYVFLIIFFFICIKFLTGLLETFFKAIGLNFTNEIAGSVLGLFKAVFILSLVCYFLVTVSILNKPFPTKDFSYFEMLYQLGSMLIKSYVN